MGLRLFRRITIIPGWLYLNLSKTGISFSLRKCGLSLTAGTKGVSGSAGAPGTGLYYRESKSYSQLGDHFHGEEDQDHKSVDEILDSIEETTDGKG